MTRLRLNARLDGATARLVTVTSAYTLAAGDLTVEPAMKRHRIARSVRAMLSANEPEVAMFMLESMDTMPNSKGVYAEALRRKIEDVRAAIAWDIRHQ